MMTIVPVATLLLLFMVHAPVMMVTVAICTLLLLFMCHVPVMMVTVAVCNLVFLCDNARASNDDSCGCMWSVVAL